MLNITEYAIIAIRSKNIIGWTGQRERRRNLGQRLALWTWIKSKGG